MSANTASCCDRLCGSWEVLVPSGWGLIFATRHQCTVRASSWLMRFVLLYLWEMPLTSGLVITGWARTGGFQWPQKPYLKGSGARRRAIASFDTHDSLDGVIGAAMEDWCASHTELFFCQTSGPILVEKFRMRKLDDDQEGSSAQTWWSSSLMSALLLVWAVLLHLGINQSLARGGKSWEHCTGKNWT